MAGTVDWDYEIPAVVFFKSFCTRMNFTMFTDLMKELHGEAIQISVCKYSNIPFCYKV